MTRIIAGSAGGRRLAVPRKGTRPTSDRVREALFSSLESRLNGTWSAVRFLDVYAGSGAVGLEALSRGASSVTFVENAREALAVIRNNAEVVGGEPRILDRSAEALGPCDVPPATIAFLDQPYDLADADLLEVLRVLSTGGWIDDDSLLVLERSSRSSRKLLDEEAQFKSYGETVLWYGHFTNQQGGT